MSFNLEERVFANFYPRVSVDVPTMPPFDPVNLEDLSDSDRIHETTKQRKEELLYRRNLRKTAQEKKDPTSQPKRAKWYLTSGHGVQAWPVTHDIHPTQDFLQLEINSPFGNKGANRRIRINPSDPLSFPISKSRSYDVIVDIEEAKKKGESHPLEKELRMFYKGVLGEIVTRAVTKEFMRRMAYSLHLSNFGFVTVRGGKRRIVSRGTTYVAKNLSRHNIGVYKRKRGVPYSAKHLAEYDGILDYSHPGGKGILCIESKTSHIDWNVDSKEGRRELRNKLIRPLNDLYGGAQKDILLMAPESRIFNASEPGRLKQKIGHLYQYFASHNIGLIPMVFPTSAADFGVMTSQVLKYRITETHDEIITRAQQFDNRTWEIDSRGFMNVIEDGDIKYTFDPHKGLRYKK